MTEIEILQVEYSSWNKADIFNLLEGQIRLAVLTMVCHLEEEKRKNPLLPVKMNIKVAAEVVEFTGETKTVEFIETDKKEEKPSLAELAVKNLHVEDFEFWFGKYKGRRVSSMVRREDTRYLLWAIENLRVLDESYKSCMARQILNPRPTGQVDLFGPQMEV